MADEPLLLAPPSREALEARCHDLEVEIARLELEHGLLRSTLIGLFGGAGDVTSLRAGAGEMEGRIAYLRVALKPFAYLGDQVDARMGDRAAVQCVVRADELRQASSVYGATTPAEVARGRTA